MKSLSCEAPQSDELREYADNRLDIDDLRFIAFDLVSPVVAGGVGNCATGFRAMGPAWRRGRAGSAMMGKAGKGESRAFDRRLGRESLVRSILFFWVATVLVAHSVVPEVPFEVGHLIQEEGWEEL